jgi:hypothetical protein
MARILGKEGAVHERVQLIISKSTEPHQDLIEVTSLQLRRSPMRRKLLSKYQELVSDYRPRELQFLTPLLSEAKILIIIAEYQWATRQAHNERRREEKNPR